MKEAPNWLVRTEDGCLHGYFTLDVLLCHLSINRGEKIEILEKQNGGWSVRYAPITESDLRQTHSKSA